MAEQEEDAGFVDSVRSISSRFMESLITGKRDPIFGESEGSGTPDAEEQSDERNTDS